MLEIFWFKVTITEKKVQPTEGKENNSPERFLGTILSGNTESWNLTPRKDPGTKIPTLSFV